MSQLDEKTVRYIDALVQAAPPLTPEQAALIIRVFGPAPGAPDAALRDAA